MGCIDKGLSGKIANVNKGKVISGLVAVGVAVLALYEVDFVFDFSGSSESRIADPEVEAAYAACYAARDDEIHATAFGTIDNPDVQKEFITSSRARAAAECRALHPQSMITVEEPARFDLVDLAPRFW